MQTASGLSISLSMNTEAAELISRLGLEPLPGEGGFFRSTWTCRDRDPNGRPLGSAILFLITPDGFSALHRLRTDELWFHHAGDPAELALLDPRTGTSETALLGPDVTGPHRPFVLAPAGVWQGARIAPGPAGRGWSLFSCTLSPAWDEREFELGESGPLCRQFPSQARIIRELTR